MKQQLIQKQKPKFIFVSIQIRYDYEGKETDEGTDLQYFGARYYDSYTRVFTQPDSIIPDVYDPQQLNPYMFERGNPFSYVDPTGNYIDTLFDIAFISYDIAELQKEQSLENYVSLALDIVGAALPFATGLGAAFKISDKAIDVFRAVDKTGDIARTTDKVTDASKVLRETGEVTVKSFPEANAVLKNTFPEATKVAGAGPDVAKASEGAFKGTNIFKKDYLIDPDTGKIFGHASDSIHTTTPHINIKDTLGNKFTIIIDKAK